MTTWSMCTILAIMHAMQSVNRAPGLTVRQFSKAVDRPMWLIQAWCVLGELPATLTSSLKWRLSAGLLKEIQEGKRLLPDGEGGQRSPLLKEKERLLSAATQLLSQGMPEAQRKALVQMIDELSKEIQRAKPSRQPSRS